MERNSNKLLLTVIAIAVLIVATVGATFAYFSATSGTVEQNVTTGELRITASSSLVHGASIKPTTWENATTADDDKEIAKVGLKVDTDGTTITGGNYDIYLTTTGINLGTAKTGGALADVRWALYNDTNKAEALVTGDFDPETEGSLDGNYVDRKINTEAIDIPVGGQEDNYTLYIWVENTPDAKQDNLQGLVINATLRVSANQ